MCRECSLHVAAFGVCGVLILGAETVTAQTPVPPARDQSTTAAPVKKASPLKATSAKSAHLQLEPKAIELLQAVRGRLSAARTLSLVAVETVENRSRRAEVTLERPDKLRVNVSGDGPRSESSCYGNTMITFSPDERALVITKAPPTINECLKAAYKASSIDFPLVDLIVADPLSDQMLRLKRASYVGQSRLGGETDTNLVEFAGDHAFVQLWVGIQDKLPKRLQAVYVDDPRQLRRSVVFSDWKIDVPVRPEVFTSLNADSPNRTDSAEPRPVGTSGFSRAPSVRPLTLYTYSAKYWGSSAPAYSTESGAAGYYQAPDGYTYNPQVNYGSSSPANAGYYEQPCDDCGNDYWAAEGTAGDTAGFNLALSTSGWYNAEAAASYNQSVPTNSTNAPYEPGQIVTTLPVGCAAYSRGAAFYLCGSTWFSGVYGPNGQLYFRVISVP